MTPYALICRRAVKSDDPTEIARFLDVGSVFPHSRGGAAIHQATLEQFRKMAGSPEALIQNHRHPPLDGFTASAFYIEIQTDPPSDFKSAQITFVKDAIGGAINAGRNRNPRWR